MLRHPSNTFYCAPGRQKQEKEWLSFLRRVLLIGNHLESKQVSLEVLGCLLVLSCVSHVPIYQLGPAPGTVVQPPRCPSRSSRVPGAGPHHSSLGQVGVVCVLEMALSGTVNANYNGISFATKLS